MERHTRKLSPRLKDFDYKGYYAYFITCNTYKDSDYFKDRKTIEKIIDILRSVIREHKFRLICYCFMPNHLHMLIEGIGEESSLTKLIQIFKQKTAYHFTKSNGKTLWQRGYFEHAVRKGEDINDICSYILYNPVRKNIVENYKDYPYSYVYIKDEVSIG